MSAIEMRLHDPSSLAGVSESEADLLASTTAIGIIGNGGFMYWYEGMDAVGTIRAADAFDRMGLPNVGDAMRSSMLLFPGGAPHSDQATRMEYLSQNRERLDPQFQALDKIVWKADYSPAVISFLHTRRSALVEANNDLDPMINAVPKTMDEFLAQPDTPTPTTVRRPWWRFWG